MPSDFSFKHIPDIKFVINVLFAVLPLLCSGAVTMLGCLQTLFHPHKTKDSAFGTLFRDAPKQPISCLPCILMENAGSKKSRNGLQSGRHVMDKPYSADHEKDWQPYPVDPYSAISDDHTL